MDPFESFLKDQVYLLRESGERLGPYKTALCSGRCSINDLDLEIVPGDVIVHRQEDKSEHHFPVRNVKRREEFHGIPGGLDLLLGRKREIPAPEKPKPRSAHGATATGNAPAGDSRRLNGHAAARNGHPRSGAGDCVANGRDVRLRGDNRVVDGAFGAVANVTTSPSGGVRHGSGNVQSLLPAVQAAQSADIDLEEHIASANDDSADFRQTPDSAIRKGDMEAIRAAFDALGRILESRNVSDEAKVYAQDRLDALRQHPIVIKVMVNYPDGNSDRE